jgi:protein arginine kinase activator
VNVKAIKVVNYRIERMEVVMRCEKCNQREAQVVLRHSLTDKQALNLCEQCAIASSNHHLRANGSTGVDREMLKSIKKYPLVVNAVYQTQCPTCHLTFTAFKHIGRIGCSDCLSAFGNKLYKDLQTVQNHVKHVGDTPKQQLEPQTSRVKELTILNRVLNDAIAKEDYIEAAKIRDKIHEIKTKGGHYA